MKQIETQTRRRKMRILLLPAPNLRPWWLWDSESTYTLGGIEAATMRAKKGVGLMCLPYGVLKWRVSSAQLSVANPRRKKNMEGATYFKSQIATLPPSGRHKLERGVPWCCISLQMTSYLVSLHPGSENTLWMCHKGLIGSRIQFNIADLLTINKLDETEGDTWK